jgi:hypothetical protein
MIGDDEKWRIVLVDPFDGERVVVAVDVSEPFDGGWSAITMFRDETFTCDHRAADGGRVVAGVADQIARRFELSLREIVPHGEKKRAEIEQSRRDGSSKRARETIRALYAHAQGESVKADKLEAAMRHGAEVEVHE